MRNLFRDILIALLPLSVACSSDSGNISIPEFPVDPEGTQTHLLVPGSSTLRIDIFDSEIFVDDTLALYGNNMRFVHVGECKGVGYIIEIPRTGWQYRSARLEPGNGYVACNITEAGSSFAALYVDSLSLEGVATVKSLVPLFGRFDRFAVNPKEFQLGAPAGDTTLFIIHPTTYEAVLCDGQWARLRPNVAYVALQYDENCSGEVRTDTLILSNGFFDSLKIPIIQDK